MADWSSQKFVMPMYKAWVPEPVRPWIYLLFAFLFQLSGGIYFGNLQHMAGASASLMREDVQMIAMFGVVGVNMPFPFLFRFKLRFTNYRLLITAALVIAACNVLCLYVTFVPLLCALSYVAGFFKLCGTFECFSNIRLWISPKQDFGVFLPTIYIIILAAQPVSGWTAQYMTEVLGSWQAMHWLMTAAMLTVALVVVALTRPWHFMPKPLPLVSLDWLGCFLWSAVMLEAIWLSVYGEYYNYTDSPRWTVVLALFLPLTLWAAVSRMRRIRHPYISPEVWKNATLYPVLGMFFVVEVMNAAPHVLQHTLTDAVLHWGYTTTRQFYVVELLGYVSGAVFTILWHRPLHKSYTRLLFIAFGCLLAYQVLMYLNITPVLNAERFRLPVFLRTFGYAVCFATLTISLQRAMPFPVFFMSLTASGLLRNGVAECFCSGIYGYGLRRQVADTLSRGLHADYGSVMLVATKEVWGALCIAGSFILLLMLLYSNVQSLRHR